MPMRNPVNATWDFLRGRDLQAPELVPQRGRPTTHDPSDRKLFQWNDPGALITPPTQITSGPAQWMLASPASAQSDSNSAVWACLLALSSAHIEPPLKVWQGDPETRTATWLPSVPLQMLLAEPNPVHTNLEVWFWTSWAKHLDGNAYLKKVRSGDPTQGNVVELWPLSPRLVKPITLPGSSSLIDAYRYTYAPGKWEDIPVDNILHFRIGIDDLDHRLGLSPIKRLVREIGSDQSATQFTDALLRNFGIPGLVVHVPQGASLNEEQAESLKQQLQTRFGFENRGNVGVLTAGAELRQFGFSPADLNLEALHNVPETRIAAVMGVPPAVAGLGVGLAQSSAYASLKQIRENFTEVTVSPNWRMDAAVLNHQLKPDFEVDPDVRIGYDLSGVRALQEDRTTLFTRLDNAVRTGWVMPNEARAEVGLPPMDGGDVPAPQPMPLQPGTTRPGRLPELPAAPPPKHDERVISLKAGELTADALQALVELGTPALADDLQRFFDGQRRRVMRSLTRP
jgi:HK97 family phage portal protein